MKKRSIGAKVKQFLCWSCLVGILAGSIWINTKTSNQVFMVLLLVWFQVFFLFDFFN